MNRHPKPVTFLAAGLRFVACRAGSRLPVSAERDVPSRRRNRWNANGVARQRDGGGRDAWPGRSSCEKLAILVDEVAQPRV